MERKLHREPVFDLETLREKADAWKADGAASATIEWGTGAGPTIFYYPDQERRYGVKWTIAVETYNYNELYADYIEYKLVPTLEEALRARGFTVATRCVDQQPLLVQRQRRRSLERMQTAAHAH
jgi:hypothetical protein